MVAEQKLKGPASYFPSIEKNYGQPIDHWIKLVQKQKDMKHMEVVNWLKNEYGLGPVSYTHLTLPTNREV